MGTGRRKGATKSYSKGHRMNFGQKINEWRKDINSDEKPWRRQTRKQATNDMKRKRNKGRKWESKRGRIGTGNKMGTKTKVDLWQRKGRKWERGKRTNDLNRWKNTNSRKSVWNHKRNAKGKEMGGQRRRTANR